MRIVLRVYSWTFAKKTAKIVLRIFMKKLLAILVLGLLLHGCATTYSTTNEAQKSMIEYESIKKGMTMQSLMDLLGGYLAVGTWYYEGGWTWLQPNTERWVYGKNYFYLGKMKNCYTERDPNCYVLTDIELDPMVLYDKLLKELPSGKDRDSFIKAKGNIWNYKDYAAWKKSQEKTTTAKTSPDSTNKKSSAEPSSGSAFFVSNTGYIITNFHVIETCNDNSKIFYKNNEIDAKLIAKDEYLDLALLKVEVSDNKFITISNKAPKKLQRIIAAGYPFGKYLSDDMKFTSGIVSSLKGLMDDSTRLQIDAALNPGNSGGPIVNENTGELVAVAVAGLRKDITEAVNYGIKAGSVKNFLESNQIDPSTFSKKFSTGDIAELLESTVLYTFCN